MVLVLAAGTSCPGATAGSGLPEAYRRADVERVQQSIDRMRSVGGYQDMSPLAYTFLRAGEGAAWREDTVFRLARHAAPDEPRLHWEQAFRALREVQLGGAVSSLAQAFTTSIADPWIQLRFASVSTAALNVGCWFAVLALVAVAAVSRGRLLLHDYSDSFPRRFRRVAPACLAVLVLTTLWTSGVGPATLLVIGGLALTPYLETRGKVSFGVLVALGCLTPLVLTGMGRESMPSGEGAWGIYRVWRGDNGPDLFAELEESLHTPHRAYVLARVARRNGRLDRASRLLRETNGSAEGLVANELGNLHFLAGELDQALIRYREAATLRAGDAVPWINQHVVHLELLQLDLADEALAKARAANEAQAEELESRLGTRRGTLLPVSHPIPKRWILEEYFSPTAATPQWADRLQRAAFLTSLHLRPEYLGAFALLLSLVAYRTGSERRSHHCPSCGFVVCPRCSRRVKGSLLCSGCWTVDREKDVDAAERERRDTDAARWSRKTRTWMRVGSVVLPGWTGYLRERRRRGLAVGCVWAFAAGLLVSTSSYPVPLFPWGGHLHWLLGAGLLALTHGYGIRRALRIR